MLMEGDDNVVLGYFGDASSSGDYPWCHWCLAGSGSDDRVNDKLDNDQTAKTFGYCDSGPGEGWFLLVTQSKRGETRLAVAS